MKRNLLASLNLVLVLALLAALPAAAQGSQPPAPQTAPGSHPPVTAPALKEWQKPGPRPGGPTPAADLSALSIQMGASGTSYRLAGKFGQTGLPYPADGSHVSTPDGLTISGTDLYVTEELGDRVLKFDLTALAEPPVASLTIGHAGVHWAHDDYLSHPVEAAVDGSGNIWVAMDGAVKKFDSTGAFQLTIPSINPWEWGSDNYHFNGLRGIAVGPGGYLYVVDRGNQRIQVYDISGSGDPVHVTTIGETGIRHNDDFGFDAPWRIGFDGANKMYVLDQNNFRVQRCESGDWVNWNCTTFLGQTGVQGGGLDHLSWAGGLAVHNDGVKDYLYVADGGNGRILKCDTTAAAPVTCALYVDGTTLGANFGWPADVAVDASGKVYVSDYGNHRIQIFEDPGGVVALQDTIGYYQAPYVVNPAYIHDPWGIAVATDGSFYVTEHFGLRLRKFNAAGAQLWSIGQALVTGTDNAHFGSYWASLEGSPAIDSAGRVYVSDTGNNRVQIYTSAGAYFATLGTSGSGKGQFQCPAGVAIHPVNGDIYVNDKCNHRIQVFTAARAYKATIGMTGSSGQDNWRFNNPRGLAVDKSGNVFVADSDNHRIQKCALNATGYACSTFVGNENWVSPDYGYLHPVAVMVDGAGRVFAADEWNNRVQVFDSSGAYLTTIGGEWGTMNGDMVAPAGLALDATGNVYITEPENQRIQKFAPGYPGWRQVNVNGFGIKDNNGIVSMATFGTFLYAGTTAGQIWRSVNGTYWLPVQTNGFDNSGNDWIDHMFVFGGKLYASTYNPYGNGGQLWRTANGLDWEPVRPDGFNGPKNSEIFRMGQFGNYLYIGTWASYIFGEGAELWRSTTGNPGSWTQVEANGFGDINNEGMIDIRAFGNKLYVTTFNSTTGTEIWRSSDGLTGWTQVNTDGMGSGFNYSTSLAALGTYMYAVTGRAYDGSSGAEIWRCQVCSGLDWAQVIAGPTSDPAATQMPGLTVANNTLYLTLGVRDPDNHYGLRVYTSTNGTTWTPSVTAGFGNKTNRWAYFNNATAVFNEQLYLGLWNENSGGQIWRATAANLAKPFFSAGAQDGWILESGELTNLGGTLNAIETTFRLGDDSLKKQYRSFLSFDTSPIPDGAVINSVTLRIKQSGLPVGTNPFNILGNLQIDLRRPYFGANAGLELADFNFAATTVNAGVVGKVPVLGWYSGALNAAGRANLNKTGLTQFRLLFTLDDNNNAIADYMRFFSGNALAADRPQLIVNYTLP